VFVIKVARKDNTEKYKTFEDPSKAGPFWARLFKRAMEVTGQNGGEIKTEMFDADETDAEAAEKAVIAGKAEKVKSSKVSSPPNLKNKVRLFGNVVDAKVLKKAQKVIDDRKDDFILWANEDLDRLFKCLEILKKGGGDKKSVLDRAFKSAYQITCRGGAFGYDLITRIGDHLCKVILALDDVSSSDIKAMQVHVDAMKVIIVQNLEGDGGAIGEEVIKGLDDVLMKIEKR